MNANSAQSGERSAATPPQEAKNTPPAFAGSRSSPLQRPVRKTPAHFPPLAIGFQSVIVYLTVCTHRRRGILATKGAVKLIVEAWQQAGYWRVGRYVIMPEHIHLFCAPNNFPAEPLKNWIAFWRNHVTRAWPQREQIPIWQREYWDRQLRRVESYGEKWEYVRNNPVRHGLVRRAEDWPYQGEFHVLEWHD